MRHCGAMSGRGVGLVLVVAALAAGACTAPEVPGSSPPGADAEAAMVVGADAGARADAAADRGGTADVAAARDGSLAADGGGKTDGGAGPSLDAGADLVVSRDSAAIAPDAAAPMTFDPCPPAGAPCRIMPAGDSIAVGIGGTGGGYRLPLFRRARLAGRTITFVGSAEEGPATVDGVPFPRQHEGHRGHTIDTGGGRMGVSPLIGAAVTTHRPHIVLLMIGTNDLTIQLDLPGAPARLGAMIDKVIAAAPDALLVVAQIVPTMDDVQNQRIRTFNAALPALVKARADAGKHVALVDMYGAFTARVDYKSSLMFDRVHPKDAGYAVMSGVWYDAISGFLR